MAVSGLFKTGGLSVIGRPLKVRKTSVLAVPNVEPLAGSVQMYTYLALLARLGGQVAALNGLDGHLARLVGRFGGLLQLRFRPLGPLPPRIKSQFLGKTVIITSSSPTLALASFAELDGHSDPR